MRLSPSQFTRSVRVPGVRSAPRSRESIRRRNGILQEIASGIFGQKPVCHPVSNFAYRVEFSVPVPNDDKIIERTRTQGGLWLKNAAHPHLLIPSRLTPDA